MAFLVVLFFMGHKTFGQSVNDGTVVEEPKVGFRYLEFGLGASYIYFRDKTSTSLAYEGTGFSAFRLAGSKEKANKVFREWNVNVNLQKTKPAIERVSDWNKPAATYAVDFMYRKLKKFVSVRDAANKLSWVYP